MAAGSKGLLKEAVHQHSPFRFRGLSERLFTAWFGGFFYNQIWEDPRVDREALDLQSDSRLLVISSAGCNVLNYLVDSPESITAVDLNPNHIYLTRLKLAAIRTLPDYETFFRFFGSADAEENRDTYITYIRDSLDDTTRRFWEGGSWLRRSVAGPRINYFTKNLYNYARLGYFLRFTHKLARWRKIDHDALLAAKTPEEQKEFFDTQVAPLFDHWSVRAIGKLPFFLFGLGIPPRQYEALKREHDGKLIEMYRDRVRKLACDYPIDDNYFTWQAFGRRYDCDNRSAVPDYLKEEHYDTIKSGAARVRTEINSLTRYLEEQPIRSLDRFVFLDSQDWMKPHEIEALWRQIKRVGRPGTRIIFRTASSESPIEDALPPNLRQNFVYEEEVSRALHAQDRAAIYGGFHLYTMPS